MSRWVAPSRVMKVYLDSWILIGSKVPRNGKYHVWIHQSSICARIHGLAKLRLEPMKRDLVVVKQN